jgi:hypothetical protein
MSKLGDAIRRSQRIEAAPMGFGAARPVQRPSMLVGFVGPAGDVAAAKTAGADFIIVEAAGEEPDGEVLRTAAGDLPLAVASKVGTLDAVNKLQTAGVDALLVWDDTAAAALLSEELGYVLVLPSSPDEFYLRGIESLNLEAVVLEKLPSPFTLGGQMQVSRIAGLARKPLICMAPNGLSQEELQCLRSAGAVAILTGSSKVEEVKQAVAAMPPRRQRRDDRPVVSLPRGQIPGGDNHDDDDE